MKYIEHIFDRDFYPCLCFIFPVVQLGELLITDFIGNRGDEEKGERMRND